MNGTDAVFDELVERKKVQKMKMLKLNYP